jgi:hypothetical protein
VDALASPNHHPLLNLRANAAQASITAVVGPAQLKIIHPPDIHRSTVDETSNLDLRQVGEKDVKAHRHERAICLTWAGSSTGELLNDNVIGLSSSVVTKSREVPVAVCVSGWATERHAIDVEAEATKEHFLTIADHARAADQGIRVVGDELCKLLAR